MNKNSIINFIFLIILGAVSSLSLPPLNFWIINFFSFSIFFIFLKKKNHENKRLFFFYGWLFGFGYFLSSLYWISISLTFDQEFKYFIPFTIILIPAFLGIFYGITTLIFIILKTKNTISSLMLFSLLFGILEYVRGTILTGFPWNLIVFSFSNNLEILSIISLIGTYGFNLICISLFTCPAILFLKDEKKELLFPLFFLILVFSFYIYGTNYKKKFYEAEKVIYDYKIKAIGSNISLDRFYSNVDTDAIIKDLIRISEPDTDQKTIFIWPEGSIPNIYQNDLIDYSLLFKKKFNENHFLIIGINNKFENDYSTSYFNSFSIYDGELNLLNSYNKVNLVPFGEFLPLEKVLRLLGLTSLTNNYQSFSRGKKREVLKIQDNNFLLKILPLICYEIIYSGKLYDNDDFDLIINISEDGWFGHSIGPKQHFVHSIFRAVESGKYVIRSSNNGIAAVVNPLGIIEDSIVSGRSGYVESDKIRKIQPTVFSKYGNKIFGLLILLYIFLIISFNKIKNEQSKKLSFYK